MIALAVVAGVAAGLGALLIVGTIHNHTVAVKALTTTIGALTFATNRATLVHASSVETAKAQTEMNRQLVEAVKSRPPNAGARAH